MVSQTTLKKKKKTHTAETTGPAFRGRKQRVFALLSLGTKFFPFHETFTVSWILQGGGRGGGVGKKKKNYSAPSGWRLKITAGPSFKWWGLAGLRLRKSPTAALGCWRRGRTEWGSAAAEAESSPGWICPGYGGRWGRRISKAHQILSAPAGETEHPDVKKTIYRSYSCCQYLNDIHLSRWQV